MLTKLSKVSITMAVLLLSAALFVACGGGNGGGEATSDEDAAGEGTTLNVTMTETDEAWGYDLERATVPAGKIIFQVINEGKFEHELMVYPAQDLSHMLEEMVMAEMSGEEAGHHAEEIDGLVFSVDGEEELELEPGESGTFTVNLSPGTYELGCLIVETVGGETFTHHEKGMHATLTVQ